MHAPYTLQSRAWQYMHVCGECVSDDTFFIHGSLRTQYTCPFSCRELEAAAYGVGGATGSDPLLADDVNIFTSCVQTFSEDSKVLYTIIQHERVHKNGWLE